MSNQVGDCFKFLQPFQNVQTLTNSVFRAKSKWYIPPKVKKLALNSQLLTVQILTSDV